MNRLGESLLSARGLSKSYPMGEKRLDVLKRVNVDIKRGEALCIVGSSGAGKSTLLHILGTLDRPTLGRVFFKGRDVTEKSDEELARFRNNSMGFVFQFHHLLSEFTALENVMMPCRIAGLSRAKSERAASRLLDLLGMASRAEHFPSELSGGEQQRVAIARALVRQPEVLLADEPTGNLDSENGNRIQNLLFELKENLGLTLLVVTHEQEFARRFPKIVNLCDGSVLPGF